jgi:hypothetical protein
VRPVCHHGDAARALRSTERRLGLREKREVDEHKRVLGVVQDPGDLFGVQARIDRMTDGADAGDGVEDFQMAVGAAGVATRSPGPTP